MAKYKACCMPTSTNHSPYASVPIGPTVSSACKPSSVKGSTSGGGGGSRPSVVDVVTVTAFACYVSGFSPTWIPRACAAMDMLMKMIEKQ